MTNLDDIFFSGLIAVAVLTGLGLIVVGFIEYTITMLAVVIVIATIFGLGLIVEYVDWEDVFDAIAMFFRKIKNIKIEWKE